MRKLPSIKGSVLLTGFILGMAFVVWYSVVLSETLNGVKHDRETEFKNYEAYFKKHNCDRRLQTNDAWNTHEAFIHCTHGVWNESDFIDVANGRVPKSSN